MKQIDEIINELIDSEKSITSALLKTKVLASKLKNFELLNWTNNELSGYLNIESEALPKYRISGCNIIGSYLSGNYKVNNQAIPTKGLPKKAEELISNFYFHQGIATLEAMEKESNSGQIEQLFPSEIQTLIENNLKKKGNPFIQIIKVKKVASIRVITQILSVVRSKLLDFMLKINEEFESVTNIEELKTENEKITFIMNQTIINTNGDGNTVNTGDSNNFEIKIKIQKGDKNELEKTLEKNGISNEDTKELVSFIDTDYVPNNKNGFGIKVNSWIQKMLGKSLDGTWEISIGTASNLLSDLIKSYYGI